MSTSLSDEAYGLATAAAERLKTELEVILKGRTTNGFTCDCGVIHLQAGKVVGVDIGGSGKREHDFGLGDHIHWTCLIREHASTKYYDYSVGVSEFLTKQEIADLWGRHFLGIPMHARLGDRLVWMDASGQLQ